ncbi:hypothetical protein [Saliterribacillus persicus]|uniref:Uncharacterized protein n=1 Tax=Saliterribacillus persicus TaxID=930114 RepID=A0A368YBD7_9BACI|nr:hypothetical protein [Saliterribacillus persicus]RCW76738.1 hypothetical protein DFR57_10213 [Saliterribacillus persicus]
MEKDTAILKDLDQLFSGLTEWMRRQYDPTSGGYFYAASSKSSGLFQPDIESTAQALNILIRNDCLLNIPKDIKNKMISFFQHKQDPKTGYFFDEHPAMRKDEVMVHRALGYSINSLRRLGSVPLYEQPVAKNEAPSYTESITAYRKKWESIDLRNSWRGCDLLASSTVYIGQMDEKKRNACVDAMAHFLEEIQDPQTGLWGEGSLYVKISGTFKLHTFYKRFDLPMPNQEKIYQSIMTCLRTEKAVDMCYIRNPIDLLAYLEVNMTNEELNEIAEITIKNMKKLKRSDGAFSRELKHSPKAPNVAQIKANEYYPNMPEAVPLSLGKVEGDMNATTQATLIRLQLYKFYKKDVFPVIDCDSLYQTS